MASGGEREAQGATVPTSNENRGRVSRNKKFTVMVVVGALAIAGCSSGGGDEEGASSTTSSTAAAGDGATTSTTSAATTTVATVPIVPDTPGDPIAVGSHPEGVAVTPDGATVYVINSGDDTVTPIGLASD